MPEVPARYTVSRLAHAMTACPKEMPPSLTGRSRWMQRHEPRGLDAGDDACEHDAVHEHSAGARDVPRTGVARRPERRPRR